MRYQVDHPGDGATAIARRAAAFDHFDPVDQPRRDLLDSIHHGQRGKGGLAVDQDLAVAPVEPEHPHLGEVAVLAVALDPEPRGPLDRIGQRPRSTHLDLFTSDDLHVNWHIGEALLGSGGGHH